MMQRQVAAWIAAAFLVLSSPVVSAQFASLYDQEPFNLDYNSLAELSSLLELDAPTHELLIALHLEMMQAEAAKRDQARAELQKMREEDEDVGWREGLELSIELTGEMEQVGDRFFEDVKLLVQPEQAPLIDHMHHRSRMGRFLESIGNEISGLGALPLQLLSKHDIVGTATTRQLILQHADQEARVWNHFQRTYEAVMSLQEIGSEFDFDFDDAGPDAIADVAKAFKEAFEEVKRLRTANETLADRLLADLEGDERESFEMHWLEANYEDVQAEWPAERAVRTLMEDKEASEELKRKVEELRPAFEDRLRIARKMARVAKHRTDLDFDFSVLLNGDGPDTELYDDAMERLSGIAESYTSALKGVMTPEQRVKYGLEPAS